MHISFTRYDDEKSLSDQPKRNILLKPSEKKKHVNLFDTCCKEIKSFDGSSASNRMVESECGWEQHFVDWFSQHILPTTSFKLFLKNFYPKLTTSNLAFMPFDFLHQFCNGNWLARNCLPKSQLEAETLYAFLSKYKISNSEILSDEPEMKLNEYPALPISDEAQRHLPSKDVTIPVLISRSNLPSYEETKQCVAPLECCSSTSSQFPMGNLTITCSNASTCSSNIKSLHKVNTQANLSSSICPAKTLIASQSTATPAYAKQVHIQDLDTSLKAAKPLDYVNPRWNAEVQQFIGRTQSTNRQPIYLEYLKKTSRCSIKQNDKETPKKVLYVYCLSPKK